MDTLIVIAYSCAILAAIWTAGCAAFAESNVSAVFYGSLSLILMLLVTGSALIILAT